MKTIPCLLRFARCVLICLLIPLIPEPNYADETTSNGNAQKKRLNVILLTVDALRADHLSFYGYPRKTSPTIDRLAAKGTTFRNAVCNWPKTTPSFASILTGTYGRTNGIRGGCKQQLPSNLTTIAELLRDNGYYTAAIVDNANLGVEFQFNQGFADFVEVWDEPQVDNCIAVTDYAIEWLNQYQDKEFFLWVHYLDPHTPYKPIDPFDKMFVDDELYRQVPDRTLLNTVNYREGIKNNVRLENRQNLNYYIAQYDGEIAFVDSQIERVFDTLDGLNLSEHTLVIFTSDHGEELGEHGLYFEHGTNAYQATMHVPLIFSYPPQIAMGKTIDGNVNLIDLFPTILDYCKIDQFEGLQGHSLQKLIDEGIAPDRVIYSEGGYRNRKTNSYHSVIYKNEWKLIFNSRREYELYNLAADPAEKNNLLKKKPEIAEELRVQLAQWDEITKKEISKKDPQDRKKELRQDKTPTLSEQAKKQLRALGYIE